MNIWIVDKVPALHACVPNNIKRMRNTILDPSIFGLLAKEESWYIVTYVFMVVVIYKVQNFEGTLLQFNF